MQNFLFANLPFERGKILFSKGFSVYTDIRKLQDKAIGVSEAQLRFVTNTASGMGLIKCGSVVIPFDNQISKDTDLYRLYNTNIHEKIAMMKKEKLPEKVNEELIKMYWKVGEFLSKETEHAS